MNRIQRHKRLRKRIRGTKEQPRLSVYRSLRGMWVQIIDDDARTTLTSTSHKKIAKKISKMEQALLLGRMIAEQAKGKHISKIVFDRGGYRYHGRVRALAEGAREGGLLF
ncbi:MAG: 50S ribosomal protein L18 [Candidatus Jacksonbacteria bacterium RIFOXYA2_FULL_44_7]|uniref:Large ribosomal subunit protein uL18 n=1 Tax=Candidatus Jacksonbacteria bacterium RIFCSPLOWO2_02_FULL_44_20 TaxID=1798460 RepID=A0A1G2AA28_9BACT|nr:MAG: 50S ribosomal protein L18 [Candidatus Jacksonbacteria bacterium RIFCSPHIGHO2_12_FULL_44_12]OGY71555.1 MAG: 50S ribosomal protein L18 [Candidatus Jacksonbacteria bacterium RIFCSPHIGHO2_02_FULL_44_25]OGY73672.1 MAG: 50S ribosomal protein L18 [Candidatus Jacksonbacteria bacterium RIFCSPLOWO2_02_FULL_44_20]OGY74572.1 MAG: 50S ribosomal protein L18 [Candidatus Jacksonbacteria bacterium RIFOXYA2_FULL_44_7]OGY74625.1 MAG: 50S ribosomal protein L18 [Candidatus Jacksonbacteria bacterium RIFCSPLO